MWTDYVDDLARDFCVLLFDYPQELRTNQALVAGMHAFFAKPGVRSPIFVGTSDGGTVAQIYVQRYPGETGGLVLISTGIGGMTVRIAVRSMRRPFSSGRKITTLPFFWRKALMPSKHSCP